MKTRLLFAVLTCVSGLLFAAESREIKLPAPEKTGGMPLMQALNERKSTRSFKENAPLPEQILGNLLWAACGYNRPDMRTAPSAMNRQPIEVYLVRQDGAWFYDGKKHAIVQVATGDLRSATGKQDFVKTASANLVFVADMRKAKDEAAAKWFPCDASFAIQNVYLYCASQKLGAVVRGYFDEKEIADKLNLPDYYKPVLTMSIGFPK